MEDLLRPIQALVKSLDSMEGIMATTITIQAATHLETDTSGEGGQCEICKELIFSEGYRVVLTFNDQVLARLCHCCGEETKELQQQIDYDRKHPQAEGQPQWN